VAYCFNYDKINLVCSLKSFKSVLCYQGDNSVSEELEVTEDAWHFRENKIHRSHYAKGVCIQEITMKFV